MYASRAFRRALVLSASTVAAGLMAANVSAGIYGYWHFDEADPNADAIDSGPHGITLTRFPDATRSTTDLPSVPGDVASSQYNGQSGGFASNGGFINDNAAVDPYDPGAGDFTLEGWVKWNGGDGFIMGKDHNSGAASEDRGYKMIAQDTDQGTFRIRYVLRTTVGGFFNIDVQTNSGGIPMGEWHHVAGVRQAGNMFIYVDGVKQNEERLGDLAGKDFRSRVPFVVGSGIVGGGPNQMAVFGSSASGPEGRTLNGGVDEIRLSNRALLPTQFLDATNPKWNLNGDGDWSNAANWLNGVPNAVDAVANFTDAINAAHTVTVDSPQTVAQVNFNNTNAYTVAGSQTLTFGGTAGYTAVINDIAGSHTISAPVQLNSNLDVDVAAGSTMSLTNDASAVAGVLLTKTGNGTLAMKNVRLDNLTVSAGEVAILANGTDSGTSKVSSLNISGGSTPTAKLDLADNDLIIDYGATSPLATIQAQVTSGYASGAWTGNGIRSSAAAADSSKALGLAEASAVVGAGGGTFSGQSVDATAVLVKYTWAGDTNLDGQVDVIDLGNLATAWQTSGVWTNGDSNYDGFIDVIDLGMLATNWQAGVGSPLGPGSLDQALAAYGLPSVSVPEPAALGLFCAAGLSVVRRRRR